MGRKIYTSSSLQMHIKNQQAFSKYDFVSWAAISKFADKLLESSREEFIAFIAEGHILAKTLLQSALDMADAAARIMALAVTIRRPHGYGIWA